MCKDITQERRVAIFVHGDEAFYVGILWRANKGKRAEVLLNERNIRGKPGRALIDVNERLKIGNHHHGEKGLLVRFLDRLPFCYDFIQNGFDPLLGGNRYVARLTNRDRTPAHPTSVRSTLQQSIGQQRVQSKERRMIELNRFSPINQVTQSFTVG